MTFFSRKKTVSAKEHLEDPTFDSKSPKSKNDPARLTPKNGTSCAFSKYTDESEVDYDKNPTKLYSLIEGRQWDEALSCMEETPEEVSTWVTRREADSSKLRWRLLPIHATCIFRAPVNLIEAMLKTYGDGAQMKDDQGMLPIHLACRNGASKGVVMLLLDYFPESIDIKDRKGRTPLAFCKDKQNQNCEVVSSALKQFIRERKEAAANSQEPPSPRKMGGGASGPSNGALRQNEVDYEHRTLLFRHILKKDWVAAAARCKDVPDEAWTWIVTKGFKGNLRFLPLHKACVLQPPEALVENLVAAFPDGSKAQDQDGWLPIHCAAFYGAGQEVVDTLLVAHPKGAQSKDEEGRLPVHYACLKGANIGVVTSLLGTYPKGAQSKDDEGRLPIHHACSKNAPLEVIEALLATSPKGSASKDDQGRLPLHHACRKNASERVIATLLKSYPKGAQIKDDQEKLPIHYACQCTNGGNVRVVNSLLHAFPMSIQVKNGFGYTPLAEARAMDNPKMDGIIRTLEKFKSDNAKLLSKHGAADPDIASVSASTAAENEALKKQVQELNKTVTNLGSVLRGVSQLGNEIQTSLAKGKDSKSILLNLSEKLSTIETLGGKVGSDEVAPLPQDSSGGSPTNSGRNNRGDGSREEEERTLED